MRAGVQNHHPTTPFRTVSEEEFPEVHKNWRAVLILTKLLRYLR
jgi:hypothetical protein